jgi:hypothetical protein
LARLARDRPDLLAQLKTGELRSVRQACQIAGWVPLPGPRFQQTGEREWTVRQRRRTLGYIRQSQEDRWVVWAPVDPGDGFAPVAQYGRFEDAQAWWQQEGKWR